MCSISRPCGTQVRTGGKGTVRRKKKAVHKTTSTDDKRLQSVLKRVGVNVIPGIEEVGQHTPAVTFLSITAHSARFWLICARTCSWVS